MMIAEHFSPTKAAFWKVVGWGALAVVLASIAVLWVWNTLAGDLFALPDMRFRHAFAVVLLAAILAAILSRGGRRYRSDRA